MTIEQIRRATMHDTTPRMNTLVIRRLQHQLFDRAKSWEESKERIHLPQSTRKTLMALFEKHIRQQPDIFFGAEGGAAEACHLAQCYWAEIYEAHPTLESFQLRKRLADSPVRLWDMHLFVYLRFADMSETHSWNVCLQVPLYMINENFPKAWRNTVNPMYRTKVFTPTDAPLHDMAYVMSYRPPFHDFAFVLRDNKDVCYSPEDMIADWRSIMQLNISYQHERLLADVMERAIKDNGRRKNYARR